MSDQTNVSVSSDHQAGTVIVTLPGDGVPVTAKEVIDHLGSPSSPLGARDRIKRIVPIVPDEGPVSAVEVGFIGSLQEGDDLEVRDAVIGFIGTKTEQLEAVHA